MFKFFIVAGVLLALVTQAHADAASPFATDAAQRPKIVRLLAPAGFFDPHALAAFEQATGYGVAYDAYSLALEIPEKWKDGPYDVAVMPGPALSRRVAAGALQKIDRKRLANAHYVQASVDQKLAVYDPGDANSIPFGWTPYGLLYDTAKVLPRLGAAPNSWGVFLEPRLSQKLADCGVAAPNLRDAVFLAVWRYAGIDPARIRPVDVKFASAVLARSKTGMQAFASPDPIGSLARGAVCLTVGTPGEAEAANRRARTNGARASIAFVEPREGGGVEIDAFAIPRDAPNPDMAYSLIDFLLTPEIDREDVMAAGLNSSGIPPDSELFRRLFPLGAFDEGYAQALETEWTHLRTSK